MSVPPEIIMKKIMKYNLRVPARIGNVPVFSKNAKQHDSSAAKERKRKEEDDLEDCNDHNYYKPTPRMNASSNKYSMLYNALTSHTKEDKQCNRNIIEQTYSEISMPLHDDEVLSDVDLVEPSTSSGGIHSSHNQVADENTPRKRRLHIKQNCAIGTQVKMKSNNEKILLKRKKVLEQKLKRQNKYINHMKSLLAVVKKYTSQSDIENIIKGNFTDLCKLFKKSNLPNHPQGTRYSDEVKAFAFMLHFHSPKAYELLRSYVPLPHTKTLRKSVS